MSIWEQLGAMHVGPFESHLGMFWGYFGAYWGYFGGHVGANLSDQTSSKYSLLGSTSIGSTLVIVWTDMWKDTNLQQSDFGGPQIATKSAWSLHVYIPKNFTQKIKNGSNVPNSKIAAIH